MKIALSVMLDDSDRGLGHRVSATVTAQVGDILYQQLLQVRSQKTASPVVLGDTESQAQWTQSAQEAAQAVDTQTKTLPLAPLRRTVDSATLADMVHSVGPQVDALGTVPLADGPTMRPARAPRQATALHAMPVGTEQVAVRQHSAAATVRMGGMRRRRQLLGRVVTIAWSVQ